MSSGARAFGGRANWIYYAASWKNDKSQTVSKGKSETHSSRKWVVAFVLSGMPCKSKILCAKCWNVCLCLQNKVHVAEEGDGHRYWETHTKPDQIRRCSEAISFIRRHRRHCTHTPCITSPWGQERRSMLCFCARRELGLEYRWYSWPSLRIWFLWSCQRFHIRWREWHYA